MEAVAGAEVYLPAERSIDALRGAAEACHGCELYKNATRTVFGVGPAAASLVLVGETPGDREDIEGQPFVGPAGKLLFRAIEEAGIARDKIYVTNAVKHFKYSMKGKRRIHEKPRASEMRACHPWLEAELEAVRPELIACLGATAVNAVLGTKARVMRDRGRIMESVYGPCLVTVHPSSILRAGNEETRRAAFEAFVVDLRRCRKYAA